MPDTRFSLIGKCVVFLVKMPDSMLRTVLKEMKQLSKVRKTIKKTKRKTRRKESQAAINRRMAKVRAAKR